jgi:antirestriction protein ArdC
MDWYIVIKTINGRRYYYRQKTWREGGRVRTRSEYIGPAGDAELAGVGGPSPAPLGPTKKDVDGAIDILQGERAAEWTHHWASERRERSLVKKDPWVERVLRGLDVKWTHNTTGAHYDPTSGVVNIPPARCFMDKGGQTATQAYYIVLFHELVHWTMAASRANRPTNHFSPQEYAREELVAELGAVVLMRRFGLELGSPARHALYFQTWLGRIRNRDAALNYAKKEAVRAVEYILKNGKMVQ